MKKLILLLAVFIAVVLSSCSSNTEQRIAIANKACSNCVLVTASDLKSNDDSKGYHSATRLYVFRDTTAGS